MKILDNLYSLFVFSIAAMPAIYLLDKHGLKGFIKLVGETFNAVS